MRLALCGAPRHARSALINEVKDVPQDQKECRENLSHQIPWPNIIGMRNRLIHAYFDINLDILWKTVTEDIPLLIDNLEKVLPPNEIQ